MNNLNFFINTMVYPFLGMYLLVGTLGLFVSGLATYEQKSLIELFTTNNGKFTILFILSLTLLNSIRMTFHGILRHKLYMHTIHYFFNHVCMEKLEYWDIHYDKSEMVKCILTDINIYINTISRIYGILIKTILTILTIMYLLYLESYVYVILGLFLCFMRSVLLEKLAKHWESKLDKVTEIKNELENEMTEYVNNNTQMQFYGLQNTYKLFIDISLNKYNSEQIIEASWYGLLMLSFGIAQRLIEFGVYIITQYNSSFNKITFYDTQLILVYFKLLTESIQSLSDIPKEISRNKDNINRLLKYIDKPKLINSNNEIKIKEPIIKFSDITFKYPNREKYILENFNKNILYKDKIILIGESGKGKSTIIKLLRGLYIPENGYVTINKKDVTLFNNNELQKLISIVPQEPIILENRTVKENISLFLKSEKSDLDIINVLKLVKLESLIDNLNDKVVTLSGGQKQRLAIARTILNDTDIIILDEPFSALDNQLKLEMQELVFNFIKDKTLIMITHDSETINYLNKFYNTRTINLNKIDI